MPGGAAGSSAADGGAGIGAAGSAAGVREGRRGAGAVSGLRRRFAAVPARAVGGGHGAGPGVDGDGAAVVPVVRSQLASAPAAAGHRRVDDADGAATGEPGGSGVELREGGRAAARAVGTALRREAHRTGDAGGGRGSGGVAVGGAGRRGRRFAVERGVEAGPEAVLRAGRDGRAGAAEGDGGPFWQGRLEPGGFAAGGHARSEGGRSVGVRDGRQGACAHGRGRGGSVRRHRERGGDARRGVGVRAAAAARVSNRGRVGAADPGSG